MATPNSTSPLGFGLALAFCTAVLPFYDPVLGRVDRAVTTVQPPLGLGTDPRTGRVLPDVAGGRPLLAQAILARIVTDRGALPDVNIPSATGLYGINVADLVHGEMLALDAAEMGARIDAQVRLDERVQDSQTSAVLAGALLIITITIVDAEGPFRLTLSIDTLSRDLTVLSSPT